MKQLLIAGNVLFASLTIFLVFRSCHMKTEPVTEVCTTCEKETEGENTEHFRQVLKKYRTDIWDVVNAVRTDPANGNSIFAHTANVSKASLQPIYPQTDARSIWFSLETIKQFICTIEKNNAKLKNPATNLGIRFYYAVYEDTFHITDKRNRHTLFMVPTCGNAQGGPETDFDPRETFVRQQPGSKYAKEYDRRMVTIPEMLTQHFTERKMLVLSDAQQSPPMPSSYLVSTSGSTLPTFVKNNGELCPINCPAPSTIEQIDN